MTNAKCISIAVCLLLVTGCSGVTITPLHDQQRRIADLNERALLAADKGYGLDSQKLLNEALHLAYAIDDRSSQVITLLNQSRLARHAGKLAGALEATALALQLSQASQHYSDAAQEKALIALAAGRLDEAQQWAENARTHETGDLLGRRLNLMARIALLQEDLPTATRIAEEALKHNNRTGLELEKANTLRMLGSIKAREKQYQKAEELLHEALVIDRDQAESAKIAADLEALAELARLTNQPGLHKEYQQRAQAARDHQKKLKNGISRTMP